MRMTRVWNDLEGATLGGQYRLDQFLGAAEPAVWYLTTARSGERAAIKLIPEDAVSAVDQLGAWRATRLLSHSNLLPMFDCGRAEVAGGALLYAVFEYPDDNLASALERGGLDEAETRETLDACLGALRYVHSRGLAHGAVDALHILAAGDRVKLASDTLRPISAAGSQPEDDIRALYRLLRVPYAPPVPPPVTAPVPLPEPPAHRHVEEPPEWRVPAWVYGVAAGLVIAIALAFALKPAPTKPAVPPPVAAPAPVSPSPAPPPSAARPETAEAAPQRGRTVWRVVAYTYNHYRDAERKARSINSRLPGLRAAVFTPRGKDRPPYFVALGGRMTRAEALNLRHVARAKGLPRDTFVRNYSD
jgi:eukaryotic-like serine/threonine-protein kinase